MKRAGSSPPSPVLHLPPMRFIAIARVSCASLLIDPNDIAPVSKRLTISFAGSTSSIGTAPVCLNSSRPRSVRQVAALLVDQPREFLEHPVVTRAHRMLQLRDGVRVVHVELAAPAPLVLRRRHRARREIGHRSECAAMTIRGTSRAIASRPMPPTRDGVR